MKLVVHPFHSWRSCLRCCQWRLGGRTTFEVIHHSCLELGRVVDFVKASLSQLLALPAFFLLELPWTARTFQTSLSSAVYVLVVWALNFVSEGELFYPCVLHIKIDSVQWVIDYMELLYTSKLLTWDERNHVQSAPPIVWDLNRLFGYGVVRNRVTLFVGMFDKTL